jgi:hypothetical protein
MRLALVSTVLAVAALAATAAPAAASYHRCSIGDGSGYGVTYLTSLRVNHVACSTGRRVVRAYNRCRRASGGVKGHCHHRVLHYRCRERRGYGVGQFTAAVRCTRGTKGVKFTYTQFT